jgi:hypothetical protein
LNASGDLSKRLFAISLSLADFKTYRLTVNFECSKSLGVETVKIGSVLMLAVGDDGKGTEVKTKMRVLVAG